MAVCKRQWRRPIVVVQLAALVAAGLWSVAVLNTATTPSVLNVKPYFALSRPLGRSSTFWAGYRNCSQSDPQTLDVLSAVQELASHDGLMPLSRDSSLSSALSLAAAAAPWPTVTESSLLAAIHWAASASSSSSSSSLTHAVATGSSATITSASHPHPTGSTPLTAPGGHASSRTDLHQSVPASQGVSFDIRSPQTQPFLPCNWTVETILTHKPIRAHLYCNATSADVVLLEANSSSSRMPPVTTVNEQTMWCLRRVINSPLCTDRGLRVPRVAHYVWYGQRRMSLTTLVSVLSAVRFLRPCLVLFHGDHVPLGPYWSALLHLVPHVVRVLRPRPRSVFGHVINVVEHSADVTRLQLLIEQGGVYLDTDQYLLHSVHDLRNNSAVLGIEEAHVKCGNGLLFSEPGAPFVKLWMASYDTFNDSIWAEHSTYLPYRLSKTVPRDWVTVVDTFFTPNYKHILPLYTENNYRWEHQYGLHLYVRIYHRYISEDEGGQRLDRHLSVIGDMTRHILYGRKDACLKPVS